MTVFDDLTSFERITPSAGFPGWSELPYTFTYPPAWFADLERRGVDLAKLRTTQLDPPSQWSVDESTGILTCLGNGPHSWLRFDRPMRDFRAHVEWRFVKLERPALYNSGVFVRNDPARNIFTQIETGFDRRTAGFFFTKKFVEGNKTAVYGLRPAGENQYVPFDPFDPDIPNLINPAGEWNTYDIAVVGREAKLWTNQVHNSLFTCELDEGYFGLEAEMHHIEFRNIAISEHPR
ncbi:3-keto-disaccharide hydrolase [Devosia nitrariae]|uniref:3-keto-alpha-glucoside-1,2-lyase/3-keto-2-hydroxy-glucal hydratase domain-containing protein n=1 Tax=Devosia nitrariae TaxID=2071872 RepID=A0ABQ5W8E5_9HYPH|nr:DUF1080 domain-containing protein [Devosia nitrariae]GLQ56163.1 hypothetical protein GCM10010862_34220 [Devosia nitrariae]